MTAINLEHDLRLLALAFARAGLLATEEQIRDLGDAAYEVADHRRAHGSNANPAVDVVPGYERYAPTYGNHPTAPMLLEGPLHVKHLVPLLQPG